MEELGRASQLAPPPPALWPGLSKPVWQAARPGVGAVTDRLVIGKLPSLAQECCLVAMATFTTSSLTKAQGICYLKPEPQGALGFRNHACLSGPVPFDPITPSLPSGPPGCLPQPGLGEKTSKGISIPARALSHIPRPGLAWNQVHTGRLLPP